MRILSAAGVLHRLPALTRGAAAILMLHRFRDPDRGIAGHDAARLETALAELRRYRYRLTPLAELAARLVERRPPPPRTVVFTVDDGYADFADVALPVFARYDCPVTVFVATGFLDGALWMWWDQAAWALEATRRRGGSLELGGGVPRWEWSAESDRRAALADLTERLKQLPDDERRAALARLAEQLEVELPARPPAAFAPLTWESVRAAERRGATVAPHTVTHPILSRVSDAEVEREIGHSWARVRAEAAQPVPVFCYPNGTAGDFGAREQRVVAAHGFLLALTALPGYATAASGEPARRFAVPRFAYSERDGALAQVVSGLERVKQALRRARAA